MTDQSAKPLTEADDSGRKRKLQKPLSALALHLLAARFIHRFPHGRKRQARHNHAAQRVTHHVDPFPERVCSEQHTCTAIAKDARNLIARAAFTLHQQPDPLGVQRLTQQPRTALHHLIAGEKPQRAPAREDEHIQHQRTELFGIDQPIGARLRQKGWRQHRALLRIVKRTGRHAGRQALRRNPVHAQPASNEIKGSSHAQRCRTKDHRAPLGVEFLSQARTNPQRCGPTFAEFFARACPLHPEDVLLIRTSQHKVHIQRKPPQLNRTGLQIQSLVLVERQLSFRRTAQGRGQRQQCHIPLRHTLLESLHRLQHGAPCLLLRLCQR